MKELIESAREIMRKRCSEIDGKLNVALASFVLDLQTGLNLYAIFTVNGVVNTLWDRIVKVPDDAAVTAFIDGAIEFRLRNELGLVKWKDIQNLVRDVASLNTLSAGVPNEGPVGIYERNIVADKRLQLLQEHDWLVFLVFLLLGEPIMDPGEIKAHTDTKPKE